MRKGSWKAALAGLAVALGLSMAASRPAEAGLALTADMGWIGHGYCGGCAPGGTTFGFSFSVSQSMTIDGLGMWDEMPNGVYGSYQVGLWSGDGSTLLASTTISNATTTVVETVIPWSGRWLFETISPVTLAPATYLLGSTLSNEEFKYFAYFSPSALNPAPGITILDPLVAPGGLSTPGLVAPTQGWIQFWVAANMRIQDTDVPEPASLALLGAGIAGIGLIRRRRTQSAQAVA